MITLPLILGAALPAASAAAPQWSDVALAVAVKGAAILGLALVATRLLRRQPAAVRHTVWLTALLAQLLTPALGALLPGWWPAVPAWTLTVDMHRGPVDAPAAATVAASTSALPTLSAPTPMPTPLTQGDRVSARVASGPAAVVSAPWSWTAIALAVWGTGAALVLLWLVVGSVGVTLIARRATRVTDGAWLALATELSAELGVRRGVVLMRGHGLAVPVTWGVLVPVVLLPIDADEWSAERRRTVLLHELAHVRRLDMLSQLAAHVVLALCWFDPLVWVGVRALRAESEKACDDCVIRHGTEPSAYVNDLLAIVRAARPTRVPALAALAMARPTEFEGRVLAILDASKSRRAAGRLAKLATIAATFLVVAPLAAMRPADATQVPTSAKTPAVVAKDSIVGPTVDASSSAPDAPTAEATAPDAAPSEATALDTAAVAETSAPTISSGTSHVVSSITSSITSSTTSTRMAAQPPVRVAPTPMPTPAPMPNVAGWGGRSNVKVHVNPKVHENVSWSGGSRGGVPSAAAEPLIGALSDSDVEVRKAAAHALGEIEDPRAVDALVAALRRDTDAGVRETAAWALGQLEDHKAVPALMEALQHDAVPAVRNRAAWALGQMEDKSSVEALGAALRDQSAEVRRTAVWALGQIEDTRAVPFLVPALSNPDADVRKQSAWALGQIESKDAVEPLGAALRDASPDVRETAAWALGQIEDARSVPALSTALKDQLPTVRRKAAWALGQIESPTAVNALVAALDDSDRDTRKTAAWALSQIEDPAAIPGLTAMSRSTDLELRRSAANALAHIGGEAAVNALIALVKDPDPEVRRAAIQALGRR